MSTALVALGPPSKAIRKRLIGLKAREATRTGLLAGAHHPLQVRAEMQLGEIGGLAALADHDEVGIVLELRTVSTRSPWRSLAGDLATPAACRRAFASSRMVRPRLQGSLALLLVQAGELGQQLVPLVGVEVAAQVGRGAGDVPAAEHVQELDRRRQVRLGGPGGMVADALRVERAVDAGEDLVGHRLVPPSSVAQRGVPERPGLSCTASRSTMRRARLVHADDLDLRALAAEFQHHRVQRANAGDVPEMRAADIDHDALQRLAEVEGRDEVLGRGEEDLALDDVGPLAAVRRQRRGDAEELRDLRRRRRCRTAARRPARPCARLWVTTTRATVASITTLEPSRVDAQVRDATPAEGADRHHDHDGDQRRHRDLPHPVAEDHDQEQQERARRQKVDSRPRPPDFTLITDWPIMAQPAMPPRKPVAKLATPWPMHSRFLSLGVSVRSSTIERRHQRFQQADHRQRQPSRAG